MAALIGGSVAGIGAMSGGIGVMGAGARGWWDANLGHPRSVDFRLMASKGFFSRSEWIVRDGRGVDRRVRIAIASGWASLSTGLRAVVVFYLAFAGACVLGCVWGLSFITRSPGSGTKLSGWFPVVLFLFLAAMQVWNAWLTLARADGGMLAAKSRMSRGVCPSCSYPIATLPPAEDGCIVCPECGGAWRQAPHESPDPPRA
jgi:hypothetical protein